MTHVSELLSDEKFGQYDLSSIRLILYGGYAIRKGLVESIKKQIPSIQRMMECKFHKVSQQTLQQAPSTLKIWEIR